MKIIYTTVEDFIKQEIEEHGWDYVEAQFALGYEPCLIDGNFFAWVNTEHEGISGFVSRNPLVSNDTSNYSKTVLPSTCYVCG